jgi:hypothetical protein
MELGGGIQLQFVVPQLQGVDEVLVEDEAGPGELAGEGGVEVVHGRDEAVVGKEEASAVLEVGGGLLKVPMMTLLRRIATRAVRA